MSYQQLRQSELFAGENWRVIYRAFTQVSFQNYDFDTIRQAMVEYIQRNYPEDFNDWIDTSEFVFIIDLLAYLGQSLSFRVDLNSRENFLDTAERRESILKLAKMLGYTPRRNLPARGLLKLSSVRTNEDVRDSDNNSLSNIRVDWNSTTDEDWFEKLITILNSAFTPSNPFGIPIKNQTVANIPTQIYSIESVPLRTVADSFTRTINGTGVRFEIVNPEINQLGFFEELHPDPLSAKRLIYRNDGAGNSSPNTGFFVYFKQGNLQFRDFDLQIPEENRVLDINVNGINELDVWVQEVNESGLVVNRWTKVPTVENIAFNSVDRQERRIFQVITRDNDQISVRFGDGRFGLSPTGIHRVWYRTSNGLQYQIQRREMQNIEIDIPYSKTSVTGRVQEFTLTLTFGLQYNLTGRDVGGSVPRENDQSIKQRAPQVFYTQNRMVNGEDYNIFPLQFGNSIRKVKAINRVYSGQSQFIDINDPTGNFQNTNLFADDGIIYREFFQRNDFESLPTIRTARSIIESKIQTMVRQIDFRDFFLSSFPRIAINNNPHPVIWYSASSSNFSSTGEFRSDNTNTMIFEPRPIGPGASNNYIFLREGALVKFVNPLDTSEFKWVKIQQVIGNGIDVNINITGVGPVTLSEPVATGWIPETVISAFRTTFIETELSEIEDQINSEFTFAIRYDQADALWRVVTANNISQAPFSLANSGDQSGNNLDASWLVLVEYLPGQGFWRFTSRNLRYIFESEREARFFFINDFKVVDSSRNQPLRDFIKILKFNTQPLPSNQPLGEEILWNLVDNITYPDGFIEPRRVQVSFTDRDLDGVPDDPDIFDRLIAPANNPTLKRVFQKTVLENGYQTNVPITGIIVFENFSQITNTSLTVDQIGYVINEDKFYQRQPDDSLLNVSNDYQAFVGRNSLNFQWKHYAPTDQRIDPAITNIIDVYVLTESYFTAVQDWTNSTNRPSFPKPPTNDDLRIQFSELEKFKMVSDEIVWKPAEFKLLFGDFAEETLKAKFKIVKVPGTTLTDNEIKQRVVAAINEFFDVDNWLFGESFYFTELSAYIHQQLATIVGSVVIVPDQASSKFGTLFEVRSEPNQLFLSTAGVNNIEIVDNFNQQNLRIGR
jgi:hypothetical protein